MGFAARQTLRLDLSEHYKPTAAAAPTEPQNPNSNWSPPDVAPPPGNTANAPLGHPLPLPPSWSNLDAPAAGMQTCGSRAPFLPP